MIGVVAPGHGPGESQVLSQGFSSRVLHSPSLWAWDSSIPPPPLESLTLPEAIVTFTLFLYLPENQKILHVCLLTVHSCDASHCTLPPCPLDPCSLLCPVSSEGDVSPPSEDTCSVASFPTDQVEDMVHRLLRDVLGDDPHAIPAFLYGYREFATCHQVLDVLSRR